MPLFDSGLDYRFALEKSCKHTPFKPFSEKKVQIIINSIKKYLLAG